MKTVYYGIEVLNMTIDSENLLNSIIETFGRMTYISPDEIPDIDLYMDQVTTFMDDRLKPSTRNKGEEKLMTKTMINNYAKNDVIPPPIKKKYNKEHVLILILLYYFKSILQINDIKDLLDPIIAKFFDSGSNYGIEEIYNEIFADKGELLNEMVGDIAKRYEKAQTQFSNAPESERDYLQVFSLICSLGCDVFVKKLLIEKIVDSLKEHRESDKTENKYDVTPDKVKKKN